CAVSERGESTGRRERLELLLGDPGATDEVVHRPERRARAFFDDPPGGPLTDARDTCQPEADGEAAVSPVRAGAVRRSAVEHRRRALMVGEARGSPRRLP